MRHHGYHGTLGYAAGPKARPANKGAHGGTPFISEEETLTAPNFFIDPEPCFTSTNGADWPQVSRDPEPWTRPDHKYVQSMDFGTLHGARPTGEAVIGPYRRPPEKPKPSPRTATARAVRALKQRARKAGASLKDFARGVADTDPAAKAWLDRKGGGE